MAKGDGNYKPTQTGTPDWQNIASLFNQRAMMNNLQNQIPMRIPSMMPQMAPQFGPIGGMNRGNPGMMQAFMPPIDQGSPKVSSIQPTVTPRDVDPRLFSMLPRVQ